MNHISFDGQQTDSNTTDLSARDCYDFLLRKDPKKLEQFVEKTLQIIRDEGEEITIHKRKSIFDQVVNEMKQYVCRSFFR